MSIFYLLEKNYNANGSSSKMLSELSFILNSTKCKLIYSDSRSVAAGEWGSRKGGKEQLQRDTH